MTEFNRREPEVIGIKRILVLPHRIEDNFNSGLVRRQNDNAIRLLYVGHLCSDRGTPQLLEAFANLREKHPELELELELELFGECLPPFSLSELNQLLDKLRIRSHVRLSGVLTGDAKGKAFGRADLFVFPTIAPYESFGLVLLEAMSWKLPIVATRWRGNFDVLTPSAGAVGIPVSPRLSENIAKSLEEAFEQRTQWHAWGERNRDIFVERYLERDSDRPLVNAVMKLLPATAER
jgi:glycosyltransferase involved in cell wall biosynthesis